MTKLTATLTVALALALGPAAHANVPPVESYWSCQAVTHPHVHISRPSQGHTQKHRCRSVAADPWTLPEPPGPKPETAVEAHYRVRAQTAERRIQELRSELHAANSRTEQVRQADAEVLRQEQGRFQAELIDLRGWANQLERLARYLLPLLADTPAANAARAIALATLNSR